MSTYTLRRLDSRHPTNAAIRRQPRSTTQAILIDKVSPRQRAFRLPRGRVGAAKDRRGEASAQPAVHARSAPIKPKQRSAGQPASACSDPTLQALSRHEVVRVSLRRPPVQRPPLVRSSSFWSHSYHLLVVYICKANSSELRAIQNPQLIELRSSDSSASGSKREAIHAR